MKLTTSLAVAEAEPVVVSASEANRSFSALLRQVAQGQSFTVQSHGRPVATLAPVQAGRQSFGQARRALLARLAAQPASGEPRTWQRDALYD
ncbi:type II toxin-antitoxin system Phd/YefM family antitoxin [Cyanobium sp. CH-040]|uniref:type II toxin-antitoxin system Phd/YefM family antitoxin n=1 Tax=Cyanobium sp. CH-040 TaxID=2823708 RepID=UPI0020CBEE43|nr:type II toxin-antitoxin system prevent-host-death family antitoxin [Cyanobium sp. CH-040]MCP9928842.1 type II toxin-antitoxin system prevent-host-death family antitoxin [Cyanobium sp. CH-040]